jgi:outer membrane lipoprotein-sorting protein
MQLGRKVAFFVLAAAALLAAQAAAADDLKSVLAKLDAAAEGFHTTSAHVEFDTIQTEPIPDKDVLTGSAYYERNGNRFQMAAHLTEHNKRPTAKTYILSGGTLRVSDTGKESDAKTYTQAGKYESYLMLGFGASGAQLEEKWTTRYLGTETIDGVKTDELELVAKDPNVRKTISKVTIWLDTARAVSLKQVFDEGEGQSYVCYYSQIKVNQPLPKGAFSFDAGK